MLPSPSGETSDLAAPGSIGASARVVRRPRVKTRFLVAGAIVVAAIAYMIFAAMQDSTEYFITTGELKEMGSKALDQPVKLGGRTQADSFRWDREGNSVSFMIADEANSLLPVVYRGAIPDTFQPGSDVVLEGRLGADGTFRAHTLMAKCASKYTPAS